MSQRTVYLVVIVRPETVSAWKELLKSAEHAHSAHDTGEGAQGTAHRLEEKANTEQPGGGQ